MKDTISFAWSSVLKRYDIAGLEERPGTLTLASWLSAEMCTSLSSVDDCIDRLNEVAAGKRKAGYLGTGNCFSIMAVGEYVFIENEYREDQKVFLTRAQAIDLMSKYRDFASSDIDNPHVHPEPIEVEYLAESQEAAERYAETGGSWGVEPHELQG